MAAITVSNTDWSIVSAVRDALAAAAVASGPVFESVSIVAGQDDVKANRLCGSPVAVVRYLHTRENAGPEDVRGACVSMEIVLATAVESPGLDDSAVLAEALRLKNAAINAVEADPPAAASAWGAASAWQDRIRWREPRIDTSAGRPWVLCRLGLEVGYVVASGVSH